MDKTQLIHLRVLEKVNSLRFNPSVHFSDFSAFTVLAKFKVTFKLLLPHSLFTKFVKFSILKVVWGLAILKLC